MYNDFSPRQKQFIRYGTLIFFIGAIGAVFAAGYAYIADGKAAFRSQYTSEIVVSGEGKVAAKPDIAILNATVVTERPTVSTAQAENARSYNAVVQFLKESGVEERDIKTTGYSIYPQYFYPPNRKPEITGYQIRNTLEVKIRNLANVDDILGGIIEHGVNEIGAVSFTIEDPNALKEEARRLAIEMAREKARVLSKDLGVRLSRLVGFSETEQGVVPPPIFRAEAGGFGGGGPDLSQGEQEIKVFVTLTYEFKSRR